MKCDHPSDTLRWEELSKTERIGWCAQCGAITWCETGKSAIEWCLPGDARLATTELPVPLILHCPGVREDGTVCGARHIDHGEWTTRVHHTHSCQSCGFTWRPAVVATVGVEFLPGFKNDR